MPVDVTEADFESVVLEGSRRGPVVVDFWASWCAPCRSLGPVLERVADETGVTLAKVDVDANPSLASAFGVRSIPMVLAFDGGQPVDEFVGAIPEQQVRAFFAGLAPSEADRLTERAAAVPGGEGEALLRRALELEPGHAGAGAALARLLAERGASEEARALLATLAPTPDVERIRAELDLGAAASADPAALEERVRVSPEDPDALVELGRALAAAGRHDEALPALLSAVKRGSDDGRQAMLDVFRVLGDDDPLTRDYRPRLAAAIF